MKNLVIIIGLMLAGLFVRGQLAQQAGAMEQANQLYLSASYAEAAEQYQTVLASGYESAVLYFNLGNAYFKLNDIPSAVLYYEKARKLDPTDEDIKFNLNLANSRIIDKMEPLPDFFLKSWWSAARDIFSSNKWASLGLAGFIAGLAAAIVFIISSSVFARKLAFWAGVFLITLMSVSFLFSISSYREYSKQSSAIVFTPTVTVKSSPAENSVDLFVIHEGTKVLITDKVEGWSEVRLANGNVGWVRTDTFRLI
jgi:tetratricopeptide (TPR) repeat protein